MIQKIPISVVWLKRDLRLEDNEAIFNALKSNNRVLIMYAFEPLLLNDNHYSKRHWDFIKQSLVDINKKLESHNSRVLTVQSEVVGVFNQLQNFYQVKSVFSHKETGLQVTFDRDKTFARYCKNNLIDWIENDNNGVQRGIKNREHWFDNWNSYMSQSQFECNPSANQLFSIEEIEVIENLFTKKDLTTEDSKSFQKGGTTTAWKYADTFFETRHKDYMFNISKPELSRSSCSRLSPYISWGNVSVRQIYQKGKSIETNYNNKRHIGAFLSRLRWQAHFIQKFEMEHIMENSSVNKGYHKLKKSISKHYKIAWETGNTGFPLVDASMRCLNTTGYLNFRMRAMLVSFFTHILWQPWQEATKHLSQMFLDFEPGIHFPQLQMQAGETGINNLRIYNPIKNGIEHDPEAIFIKKWVPELANLETHFAHEPYLMTELEQQFYNFKLGVDYPYPIVDIKETRKKASDILWNMKKNPLVKKESKRILNKHTLSDRSKMLKNS